MMNRHRKLQKWMNRPAKILAPTSKVMAQEWADLAQMVATVVAETEMEVVASVVVSMDSTLQKSSPPSLLRCVEIPTLAVRRSPCRCKFGSGNTAVDQAIENQVLDGLQLPEAPPADMPMPITLRISARKP